MSGRRSPASRSRHHCASVSALRISPITGRASEVPDTVYQNQTVSIAETLELLVIDDRLIEWKVKRDARSSFH